MQAEPVTTHQRLTGRGWTRSIPNLGAATAPAWSWWLAPIIGVAVGLPLLIAALSGNLAIPHNDGWAYSKITELFARTGQIHLIGWNRTSLVGQVVMLGPLGRWLPVQQSAVAVLGAVAIWACYDLLRFTLPRRRTLAATATFAIWPGYAALSTSFMSDIPALTSTLLCLSAGQHAPRRDSRGLMIASVVLGFWAFTIREQSIAAPVAVLAYTLVGSERRTRLSARFILTAIATLLVVSLLFLFWRNGLPGSDPIPTALGRRSVGNALSTQLLPAYFTLSAALLPMLLLGATPGRWKASIFIVAVLIAAAALLTMRYKGSLLVGNYFTTSGSYPDIAQPSLWSRPITDAINLLAAIGAVLLTVAITQRWRGADPILTAFTALTAVATLFAGITNQSVIDRYLIVMAPWFLTVALLPAPAPAANPATNASHSRPMPCATSARFAKLQLASAVCAFAGLLAISALLALNAFSLDHSRWMAAKALTRGGVPATRIDAGGVWDGWVSPNDVRTTARVDGGYLAYGRLEDQVPCLVFETVPLQKLGADQAWRNLKLSHYPAHLTSWTLFEVARYKTYLWFGNSRTYIYATNATGCPTHW